jgi:hypothetical protein
MSLGGISLGKQLLASQGAISFVEWAILEVPGLNLGADTLIWVLFFKWVTDHGNYEHVTWLYIPCNDLWYFENGVP